LIAAINGVSALAVRGITTTANPTATITTQSLKRMILVMT
jgi:hypothetical protein